MNQQTEQFVLLVGYGLSFVDVFFAESHLPLRALMMSDWEQHSSLCIYISCFISLLVGVMSFLKYIV